ncbi:class I tRNA ligase family protein, partial [Parvimonas micra]|uniref:class I tRNA ligase family protein n=1 Tax=Parvimonas micra TaxID=33033 RepID=UPI002B460EDA
TLDNNYIESVWNHLDEIFKKGLMYEGAKILPYCPRCGTGLASHEGAQGYEMNKTTTVYGKFQKKDEDAYFIAWTPPR